MTAQRTVRRGPTLSRTARRALPRPDEGMSLVEVVVAVVVLGIIASAVLAIMLQAQAASANNRSRVAAANLAAREMDMVREEFARTDSAPAALAAAGVVTNPHALDGQTAGQPLVIDGTSYTVVRSVAWNITGDGQSACDGGSLVQYPTLGVTVSVTWPTMGRTAPVVTKAALAPAKGEGVPGTASFVAVRVDDSAGDPNPGRTVRVSGSSEVRTALTDASGCAVVQVNPGSGGTSYTAELVDTGYVDVNGSSNPSKLVGNVQRGQLNNSATFSYDRAATLQVRIVDDGGTPVDGALVAGTQLTIVAAESSGSTSSRAVPVTGSTTNITDLWPTTYGAYYGATAPSGGYPTVVLAPGATGVLDATLMMATGSIANLPPETTSVIAVPQGLGCSASAARAVDPAAFTLAPGTWDFYASGANRFDCSPGPAAWNLAGGANTPVPWGSSTFQVATTLPGHLWAVNASKVAGALSTCPGTAYVPVAVDLEPARGAPVPIAAGDWYVYRTDGAPDGACLGVPTGQYAKNVAYDALTTLAWNAPNASVRVTGASTSSNQSMVYSTSSTTPSCTRTSASTGYIQMPSPSGGAFTVNLAPGTWHFYSWNMSRNAPNPRCVYGGAVVVGGQASYTVPFNPSSPPVVGP